MIMKAESTSAVRNLSNNGYKSRAVTPSTISVVSTPSTSIPPTTSNVARYEYDESDCDCQELEKIFNSTVFLTEGTRDGAQSTFREDVIRKILTRNEMKIELVPKQTRPYHLGLIKEDEPTPQKRKQSDSEEYDPKLSSVPQKRKETDSGF